MSVSSGSGMSPQPQNIDGKKVETHEFTHSVQHRVNWSHVLGFVVLLYVTWKLGPTIAEVVGDE